MIRPDLLRAAEQEARLAGLNHRQVVVALARRDGLLADALQCPDGRQLGLLRAHAVIRDLAVLTHHQRIAEDRRPVQLFHQRGGELLKGVT